MKKILLLIVVLPVSAWCNQRAQGFCQQGGQVVVTSGLNSLTKVQASYPQCLVTVFLTGTQTRATIYSDNSNTPLANPFNANSSGLWFFYAVNGHYDVALSGADIPSWTIGDILLADPASGGTTVTSITAGNGISVNQPTGAVTVTNTWGAPALVEATDYNFPPQTLGSTSAGSQVLNMAPCPPGITAATVTGYSVYLTGSPGAAEAGAVTGGNCTSGATSGTFIVTVANSHTATTVQSTSGGILEAICGLPSTGGQVQITTGLTLQSNVGACGKTSVVVSKFSGVTITGSFTILGQSPSDVTTQGQLSSSTSSVGTYVRNDAGPVWGSYSSNWAGMTVNVNGYPAAGLFGSGTVPIPEAFRGAINIPATGGTGNHGSGVAGYALTNSTSKGAVGTYGEGSSLVNGASTWGGNFNTGNCPALAFCHNNGLQNITQYGIEVDFGITNLSGGGSANSAARGIFVVNGGEGTTANPNFNGVDLFSISAPMKNGFISESGAADTAFLAGATGTGNGVNSQRTAWLSTSSGGVPMLAVQFEDSTGDLILQPGPAAVISLQDNSGNTGLNISPIGSTPTVVIAHSISNATYTHAQLASITASTGMQVYCTDCTLASTCAGSGTGHMAVFNGSVWTCQ